MSRNIIKYLKKFDIYTGGSYCNTSRSSGYGIYSRDHPSLCACGPAKQIHGSSQVENYAVCKALKLVARNLNGPCTVAVHTDHLGALGKIASVQEGRHMSPAEAGVAIMKNELIKCESREIKVSLRKVRAHSGVHGNEIADRLASYGRAWLSTQSKDFGPTLRMLEIQFKSQKS